VQPESECEKKVQRTRNVHRTPNEYVASSGCDIHGDNAPRTNAWLTWDYQVQLESGWEKKVQRTRNVHRTPISALHLQDAMHLRLTTHDAFHLFSPGHYCLSSYLSNYSLFMVDSKSFTKLTGLWAANCRFFNYS
jgi:hypothetical protein